MKQADSRALLRVALRLRVGIYNRMGHRFLFGALVAVATLQPCVVLAQPGSYSWEAVDARASIRVFTSAARRHRYDAVKATAVISATAKQLFDVLLAFEAYTAWYHNAAEVRVLSRPDHVPELVIGKDGKIAQPANAGPWRLFFRQRVPVLEDRWTVLRCVVRAGPGGSLVVEFSSLDSRDSVQGAVRLDLRGYWQLRPLNAEQTEVTFMVDADPNTNLPDFLVDPELQSAVIETLQALTTRVTQPSRPAGMPAALSGKR